MDVAVRRARLVAAAAWLLALAMLVGSILTAWALSPSDGAWILIMIAVLVGIPLVLAATIAWIVVEVRGITRAARPER